MRVFYQGKVFKVLQTAKAERDFEKLQEGAKPSIQKQKDLANLLKIIMKYADDGKLNNREKFNNEGDGFFCFKAYQTRAYFWKSEKYEHSIIISHLTEKKQDRLSKDDRLKMKNLRRTIEK